MAAAKPGGGTGTNLLFSSSATEFSFNVPFIPVSQAPAAPPGPALLPAGTERGRQGGREIGREDSRERRGCAGSRRVPPLPPLGRGGGAGGAPRAEPGLPGVAAGLGDPVLMGSTRLLRLSGCPWWCLRRDTARDYIFRFPTLSFFCFPLLNACVCVF